MLPDDVYNKYVSGERPLFTHLHGSSWHGDDAKSVLWIIHHPLFLAILTLTGRSHGQWTYSVISTCLMQHLA